jgi:hypothetical protein
MPLQKSCSLSQQEEKPMPDSPNSAPEQVHMSRESLERIVGLLSESLKPQVLYRPDHHEMTLEALDICRKNVRDALKLLQETLPANYPLVPEIMVDLQEAVELRPF